MKTQNNISKNSFFFFLKKKKFSQGGYKEYDFSYNRMVKKNTYD